MCVACALLRSVAAQPRRTIDASRALDAGGAASPSADMVVTSTLPDPSPLVERDQWVFDLFWDRGEVRLMSVRTKTLPAAQPTRRSMGRFALELFEGHTLLERLRFDFPLLGDAEPDAGWASFTRKLRTRVEVEFPAPARGTRLDLVDRATGTRWRLVWPPSDTVDAGALPLDDSGRKP
jgi:hypothetical protein